MTARLLRPFTIDVAHKPTCKLRSNFTKHKDKTNATDKRNAIYMFPCKNCPEKYIGQTSKKIQTRLTENRNAINTHVHSSIPAKHADDNGHKFDWSQTRCLGQATTKHAREFKEAWHSMHKLTFNRHIDIHTIYLQLKHSRKSSTSSSLTFNPPMHNLLANIIFVKYTNQTDVPADFNIVNKSAKIQTVQPSDEDSK